MRQSPAVLLVTEPLTPWATANALGENLATQMRIAFGLKQDQNQTQAV